MTRAKHRAGIPVNDDPTPKLKLLKKPREGRPILENPDKMAQLKDRLQGLNFRKPAGKTGKGSFKIFTRSNKL